MKKCFLTVLASWALVGMCVAGSVTPLYDGSAVTQTVSGAFTFANLVSATGANGEIVGRNDTDAEITDIFDDDAAVLGLKRTESSNAATNISAGDEFREEYGAYNDATQMTTIARVVVDFTDETDTTEDGTYEVWVQAAGTLTKICSVDASGVTVVGDVAGTTIGGITQANLLDKSATETVSGSWTFSTVPNLSGLSSNFNFLSATGTTGMLYVANGVVTNIDLDVSQ